MNAFLRMIPNIVSRISIYFLFFYFFIFNILRNFRPSAHNACCMASVNKINKWDALYLTFNDVHDKGTVVGVVRRIRHDVHNHHRAGSEEITRVVGLADDVHDARVIGGLGCVPSDGSSLQTQRNVLRDVLGTDDSGWCVVDCEKIIKRSLI